MIHYTRKPNEPLIPETIALDALVVWEWVLDLNRRGHSVVENWFEYCGIWAVRQMCLELSEYATVLHEQVCEDDLGIWPFDMEFAQEFVGLIADTELVQVDENTGDLSFRQLDDKWDDVIRWAQKNATERRAA